MELVVLVFLKFYNLEEDALLIEFLELTESDRWTLL